MISNPFASFNIEIPNKYREAALKYSDKSTSPEFAPFERQVDFWFVAFLLAVNKKLQPEKESDTYNITPASIFGTDSKRIGLIQICVLGLTENFKLIGKHRAIFDYASQLAYAGMPHLIQILSDPDDRPLWALLNEFELMSK